MIPILKSILISSVILTSSQLPAFASETDADITHITKERVYQEFGKINSGNADYYVIAQAYQRGLFVKQSNELAIRYYREMVDHEPSKLALIHLYSQSSTLDSEQALLLIQEFDKPQEKGLVAIKLYHEILSGLDLPIDYIKGVIQGQSKSDGYIYLALAHWYYNQKQYNEAYQFLSEATNRGLSSSLSLEKLKGELWSPKLLGLTVSSEPLSKLLSTLDESEVFERSDSKGHSLIPYTAVRDSVYKGVIVEPDPTHQSVAGIQLIFSKGSEFKRAYQSMLHKHGNPRWVVSNKVDYLVWSDSGFHISMTVPQSGISCDHLDDIRSLPRQQRIHINNGRCLTHKGTKSKSLYIQYNFPVETTSSSQGVYHVEY